MSAKRMDGWFGDLGRMLLAAALLSLQGVWSGVVSADDPPAKTSATQAPAQQEPAQPAPEPPANDPQAEAKLLTGIRQLTFEGRRAGEGYFSRDGQQLVFQSEREPGNPFFQIYLLDMETGDVDRVSPGRGKTTCAWIHPDGNQVLFASTHEDPAASDKQREELELRASGKERRYSWDYDEHFDLFVWDRRTKDQPPRNLTHTRGYNAEGSWSPDGGRIVFASNRRAYLDGGLTDHDRERFQIDPAYAIDLYGMDADGSNIRRLTESPGYDGGPFFSPDGSQVCWRRFTEDGATAEVMVMPSQGGEQRQLTRLGAMSWAPYFHPSGRYLIFTTNLHGFANFELYLVDARGAGRPVRVTHTDGFDGLPVFTPDGRKLAWTTNRTPNKQSQIFIGDWNHEEALRLLGLDSQAANQAPGGAPAGEPSATEVAVDVSPATAAGTAAAEGAAPGYEPTDLLRHVDYLCRPELEGRLTGTPGERLATAYVAAVMARLGLEPAGDDGTWFQEFNFTAGVDLGAENRLTEQITEQSGERGRTLELNRDWRPVAFSQTGPIESSGVVFAGYGIHAPAEEGQQEYDSFVHLDVEGKWVVVFRFMPEEISAERRQQLSRFASLRYKAMHLRDQGARGMIVVSGPTSKVREQLLPLQFDGSLSGSSLPVISVSDELVAGWLKAADKELAAVQRGLDNGEPAMGFELPGLKLGGQIDIRQVKRTGRNVLGRLRAGAGLAEQSIVVGAHVDHLGRGLSASSLAKEEERGQIHFGADDNASGVAAMLEIAQDLAHRRREGRFVPKRDILFAAWSGEELGLIGSAHFVNSLAAHAHHHAHAAESPDSQKPAPETPNPEPRTPNPEPPSTNHQPSLHPHIAACLNLDMVGRLDKSLVLQGIGSSSIWRGEIERRNVPIGLPLTLQDDSYLPTDASSFYMHGVPILSAFTGSHDQYHTPRDTPDRIDFEGASRIARLMGLIASSLATRDEAPEYVAQAAPEQRPRAALRAYLGTIPDYAESDVKGLKLSGVSRDAPAAKAGVRPGDVIVELAGKKIENIYDYTFAIEALKIGQPVKMVVQRGGERLTMEVTPGSRE